MLFTCPLFLLTFKFKIDCNSTNLNLVYFKYYISYVNKFDLHIIIKNN